MSPNKTKKTNTSQTKDTIKRELGISASGERGFSYKKALRYIKEAGFKHVMPLENGRNLERRVSLALKMGLCVPYVHLAYRGKNNPNVLWTDDKKRKEKLIKSIIKRLEICAKYKINTVVMHSTRRVLQFHMPTLKEFGLESFREIFRAAEKFNVKIALENLNIPENVYTDYIFENISAMLGFCYDCGHHYLHDPNTDFIKKYGSRCVAVHLHDNMATKNKGDEWAGDLHMLPGDGKIDFARVMKDLSGSAYNSVVMLEVQKNETTKYDKLSLSDYYREAYRRGENLIKLLEN